MKKHLTLLFFTVAALTQVRAQKNCATAVLVTAGVHGANYEPNSQIPAPLCLNGTNSATMGIWFKYIPQNNYNIIIRTDVEGTPDTRLHVYTGSCSALTCYAGDDDSGDNYSSLVEFPAVAGTTYYIAFDNKWNSNNFSFSLTETPYVEPIDYGISFSGQQVNIGGSYRICAVDMNGDYLDDIVSPGNNAVNILYQSPNGSGFTYASLPAPSTNYLPGWSMAAGDYNKDGYNDLLYGNNSGAVVLLSNPDGTGFTSKIETSVYVFSQRTNFVDINNDGNLDAFICHDVQPNVYFLNNGNGTGTFYQGGLGNHPSGGNYGSIWVDYDNDGDQDLFIAKCRGGGGSAGINEMHRNNGDGTFTDVSIESNLSDMIQTWSSAWGDFDNDGDMDLMVGANSTSHGGHKLMMNNGDGTFTDVTAGSGFDTNTSLSREHVAYDFNNDGFIDVMGGGNKIMFNNGNMTFSGASIPASSGPVGDFNNDGYLDIQNGSMVYFNSGSDNNWIKVNLKGMESNSNGIGARVEIHGDWGMQIRDVRSGDGFEFMSTLNTHFGIGEAEEIDQVVVKWPSGTIDIIENPDINAALLVTEGETLSRTSFNSNLFKLYPNPASDFIHINNSNNLAFANALVYDLNGRLIKTVAVEQDKIDVQNLSKGVYILMLKEQGGKYYSNKFIKE
ncbi:FG-GAP-like repeat-containing protein [Flavobacterium sp. MK4S-17]|uniref:FG-GAP-like repeat-containing protein n=1 Tax=Flavobacterium sp. MK4S-17 TaxID=2543737 RepID=UPI0013590298|nr:FG-GAP-like repeat-containing protein [Flavobacterium sp. MK4S-17]